MKNDEIDYRLDRNTEMNISSSLVPNSLFFVQKNVLIRLVGSKINTQIPLVTCVRYGPKKGGVNEFSHNKATNTGTTRDEFLALVSSVVMKYFSTVIFQVSEYDIRPVQ